MVVGSGISGLSLAIKYSILNPDRKVAVFSKSGIQESNTYFAQGGIAVVQQEGSDSFDLHIADTLSAGDGQVMKTSSGWLSGKVPPGFGS